MPCYFLDSPDPLGNLASGFSGLGGKRLHLLGDNCESPAGLAGAGRLDGGVERQQIGLPCDIGDQFHHFADFVGRLGKLIDHTAGLRHATAFCAVVEDRVTCCEISAMDA